MEGNTPQQESVSIWIWVGLVLCTYGLLVLGTGLYQLTQPPTTVLGNLRPGIWWGGLMLIVGALFCLADRHALAGRIGRPASRKE
jgi:drug/metabolite transporter (DMT)-like permease